MPIDRFGPLSRLNRRTFLTRAGWTGLGASALVAGAGRRRASAQASTKYPDWIPASTKPPKRGGMLTRASAWDPPVIDPRLTQSVGLYQFAGLDGQPPRALRVPRRGERPHRPHPQGRPRRVVAGEPRPPGVDVQAAPGGQVAQRAAAQRAASRGRRRQVLLRGLRQGRRAVVHFQEIEGIETPDKHTVRVHLKTPNVLFAHNVAEPIARHLPAGGARGGRRSQEAHDRHRAVHPQGAHPQGAGGAGAEPGLLGQGPPLHRRVHHPLDAGRRHPPGRVPHRPERHSSGWRARPRWRRSGRRTPTPSCRRPKHLAPFGLALAQDKPPFNDVRVRRASRWPSTDRSRSTRSSRATASSAGAYPNLLPGHAADPASSGPGGSTGRRRPRSSWPRRDIPTASRRRCSTTSTSRR